MASSPEPITLCEGHIQPCSGYLMKRSKYLKHWKRKWINIVPDKLHIHKHLKMIVTTQYKFDDVLCVGPNFFDATLKWTLLTLYLQ